jgi:hypothetical protein
LFLGDVSRYESFPTSDHDDFEVIGHEVFSDVARDSGSLAWRALVGHKIKPDRISAAAVFGEPPPRPGRRSRRRSKNQIEIADLLQILARQLGQNAHTDFRSPGTDIHGVPRRATEIAVRHYQNEIVANHRSGVWRPTSMTAWGHARQSRRPLPTSALQSGSGRPRSHWPSSGGALGPTVPEVRCQHAERRDQNPLRLLLS